MGKMMEKQRFIQILKKIWDDERNLFSKEVSKKEKDIFMVETERNNLRNDFFKL